MPATDHGGKHLVRRLADAWAASPSATPGGWAIRIEGSARRSHRSRRGDPIVAKPGLPV